MNQITDNFLNRLSHSKVIVILRHILPEQCEKFVNLLEENHLDTIEVTLNSPNAFSSIEILIKKFPKLNIGAGTVVDSENIKKLKDMGIKFIVSPNTNPEVITETLKNDLIPIPGFYTATEGFNAIKYGATILKLFPSGINGINLINDYSAVFPKNIKFIPTGGVNEQNIRQLLSKAFAVGIGSSLFSPNISYNDFSDKVKNIKSLLL
tara:strand:+ start:3801 stop:4424 length:624 start_codon:yes stop_codon:yes gene_type:complete